MKLSKKIKKFTRNHHLLTIIIICVVGSIVVPIILLPILNIIFPF